MSLARGRLAPDPPYQVRAGPILGTDVYTAEAMSRKQRALPAFSLVPAGPSAVGIATSLRCGTLLPLSFDPALQTGLTSALWGRKALCLLLPALTERHRRGVGGIDADSTSTLQLGRGSQGTADLLQSRCTRWPVLAQQLRHQGLAGLLACSASGLSALSHCIFCWCC